MGTIVIGKKVIHTSGSSSVTIVNGKMYVDGKPINEFIEASEDEEQKQINITIQGDVERLEVEVCHTIKVTGNAKRVKTSSGDIEIGGNVEGDVHTNCGSINCGNVEGDCHTNMGSIYRKGGDDGKE